jgi:PST family polysaccharide transporter
LVRDAAQFVQMLVLTRLLEPSAYGVAGYANTLISFLGLFAFQHVATHVVQMRPQQKVDYGQYFTLGLVLNGAAFVLTNAVALALPYFGQYAAVQPVLHVLSLGFLLSVPADLRQRMLEREQGWHRLRPLEMSAMVASVSIGIAMAAAGAGVYALVVPGMSLGIVFAVDLFLVARWKPTLRWNRDDYRDAVAFGANRVGSNALNGGRKLLESTLISEHFRFASLGVYGRAEGLSIMFCGRVAQQLVASLYPVITRADPHSERFQRIAGLVLRSVAWVILPIAVFLMLQANAIVTTVYGSKWIDVIPLLPLASVAITAQSLAATAYQLLLANEERALCLRSDTFAFAIATAAMWFAIPHGVAVYLCASIAVHVTIGAVLCAGLLWTGGILARGLWLALAPAGAACALGAFALLGCERILPKTPYAWLDSVLLGLVFGAAYVATLRWLFREPLVQLLGYLPGGRRLSRLLLLGHEAGA